MKGYEKYQAAMIEIIRPVLESKTDEQGEALSEAYKNYLFGLDGPKQVNNKYSRDEILVAQLFHGFIEINETYLNLVDIEVYVRRW